MLRQGTKINFIHPLSSPKKKTSILAEILAYEKACVYPTVSNLELFTFFDIFN